MPAVLPAALTRVAATPALPVWAARYADALKTHAGAVAGVKLNCPDYFSFVLRGQILKKQGCHPELRRRVERRGPTHHASTELSMTPLFRFTAAGGRVIMVTRLEPSDCGRKKL